MKPGRTNLRRRMLLYGIVLLALGAMIVHAVYRADLDDARARLTGRSEVVATPCGPIEYALAGEGPAVLVVHGAGGGFDQGLLMAEDVVALGYRVVAVSRFGYLRTPLPRDASAEAQADAHACLLDALGLDRVAVFGASAGAPSSLLLAIRHPERVSALVLLVPATWLPAAGGAGTDVPRGLGMLFDTALRWDFPLWAAMKIAPRALVRTLLGTPPALLENALDDERDRVYRMLDFVLPVTARRAGLVNDGVITTSLGRYELERVAAPTLVVSAEDDLYGTFERARYTAAEIPGARFVGFADGGHLLVGRQQRLAAAIEAILEASE